MNRMAAVRARCSRRLGALTLAVGLLVAGCATPRGEVPDGWQVVELEGLTAAVPPGWEPAPQADQVFRESQLEYHSPEQDAGLPPIIAIGALPEGSVGDVGLGVEILKARLDLPDLEYVAERDVDIPGGTARYVEYTYTVRDLEVPARQMEMVISSDHGRGYGLKLAATENLWPTIDVEAVVRSVSIR